MADEIASLVGRLEFDADPKGLKEFSKGVDDLAKASDEATTKGVALGTFLGNIATKATDLAVSVAKAAYATGKDLVTGFAEAGAELDKAARKADLGVVAFQKLQRGLKVDPDAFSGAIVTLNRGISELALTGGGPAKDALGLLGVEMRELQGLGTEDQIYLLADALAAVPDASDRAMMAAKLFGEEAGAALAPQLAQGADGLRAMGDRAQELGLILDEDAVEAAKRTKAAMGDIDRTTEALGNTIAVGLAPVVADLAERFGTWYRANEDVIAQRVPKVIDSIVTSGVAAVVWAVEFADDVADLTKEIKNMADIVGGGLVDAYATVRPLIDTVTDAVQAALVPFRAAAEEMAEIVDQMAEAVGLADEIRGTDGERSILAKVLDPWGVAQGAMMDGGDSTGIERGTSGRAAENRARRQALGQSTSSAGVDPSMPRAQLEAMALDTSLHPVVRRQARQAALAQASRERDAVDRAAREVEAQRAKDADAAQREAEVDARRKRGDAYAGKLRASAAGGGGGSKVDTREARELFGAEFEALARAAGVGDRAIRAALESAASSLESGASQAVARQAGVGQLESLSGASLSAAGGPDAALFGLLTQLGGPQAARSAADGARFVQISNTFNVTNTFSLELPPGFGAGLQRDVEGVGGSLSRLLVDQWEAVIDRFGQGVEP